MIRNKNKGFFILLIVVVGILFIYNLSNRVNSYNATIFAFSYSYGFISRGLIGTLYEGLGKILPLEMYTYSAVNTFVLIITIIFCVLFTLFIRFVLKKIYNAESMIQFNKTEETTKWKAAWFIVIFFTMITISTFSEYYNFGRVDIYLCLITMLSFIILVEEKCEWLLIPIAGIGVMIHEGYVFMYLSVMVIMLVYRLITNVRADDKKKTRKYAVILCLIFIVSAVLFLYFMFFSHNVREGAYDEIVELAKSITYKGKYHEDLVRAEILGINLGEEEMEYRLQNVIELTVFIIMMIPFIIMLVMFFKKVLSKCKDTFDKAKYIFVIIGAVATLPLFILKIDYGRWCYAVLAYYCFIILFLFAINDEKVLVSWDETIYEISEKWIFGKMLFAYLMLIIPFSDLAISKVTYMIFTYPEKIIKMVG